VTGDGDTIMAMTTAESPMHRFGTRGHGTQVRAATSAAQREQSARRERQARALLDAMTLDQKVGQLVLPIIFPRSAAELVVTPELRALIRDGHLGGYFLTAAGGTPGQIRDFAAELQDAARLPLLLATDFEGGDWNFLRSAAGPRPSAAEIGASGDPERARQQGREDAALLAGMGLNLNLAPVVDVLTNPDNPVLQNRCFGDDPALVARMAAAYLDGLCEGGVAGCLKHYPGLGAATLDPHQALPTVEWTRAELDTYGLAPFRALIAVGRAPMIMTTHVLMPALDPERPVSVSPTAIHGLLRKELGYDGVVISDSLAMGAITAKYPVAVAAVDALRAGTDLLLGAPTIQDAWRTIRLLKAGLASGYLDTGRLDAAVLRVLRFKLCWRIIPEDALSASA